MRIIRPDRTVSCLLAHRELVLQLALRELSAQFKGTFLGFAWAFARPLVLLVVYTFVFGIVWPRDDGGLPLGAFAMTMFCGMTLYSVFSGSVSSSCGSVVGRAGFVKQVVFPLEVLPFVQVVVQFVLGLCWLVLLYAGAFLVFGRLPLTSLLLPAVLLPLFLITCGISWFVASLCVYVRDLKQLVPVVMQILFFLTPIFWQLDRIRARSVTLWKGMYLNPLTGLTEALRDVLIRGQAPDWTVLGVLAGAGLVLWYLGFAWFVQVKKGFADVI